MSKIRALLYFALAYAPICSSQCAPGVPCGGNPAGIPPGQPGSPYSQGTDAPPPTQTAPAVRWVGGWGAIALDEYNRGGSVENRDSESEARKIALDQCKSNDGNDCKVVLTFNNQCAAMVQEPNGGQIHGNTGSTSDRAEQRARSACKVGAQCEVLYSRCSLPRPVR